VPWSPGGVELVRRVEVPYRGTRLEEMDFEAVLARRPEIGLVDELAHTNAPILRNAQAVAGPRGSA
jgi:two-component system, OmpR family, sensor histidine kinase KdpD